MSGVPYTFGSATTAIPLSQLDTNFATPVTIGNATVALGNTVTTIGNVTLTGSTINSAIVVNVGSIAYSPTNPILTGQGNANSTVQMVLQNNNQLSNASTDYVVSVYGSTDTTLYGDFGMNGPNFTGTGNLAAANATYVYSQGGDLALGTYSNNPIHFVINGGATDAMTVNTDNTVTIPSPVSSNVSITGGNVAANVANSTIDGTNKVGFLAIPQDAQATSYNVLLSDTGKHLFHAAGSAAATYTIPANSNVAFGLGSALTFINMSANAVTVAITTDTLYNSSNGTTGSRTLAQYGVATAIKITSTSWIISGAGLT